MKHECPECGAWHRQREGADLAARGKKGAAARWAPVVDSAPAGLITSVVEADVVQDMSEVSHGVVGPAKLERAREALRVAVEPQMAESYHCPKHRVRDPKCPYCALGG